jgi:hypothetical protein
MEIVNHNHTEEDDEKSSNKKINGIDSINELIEAENQLGLLREDLNETNGN